MGSPDDKTSERSMSLMGSGPGMPIADADADAGAGAAVDFQPKREKLKEEPEPEPESNPEPEADAKDKSLRKKSMSVAALDNVTIIDIFEDEIKVLKEISEEIDHAFKLDEITRLFADYKMNGEQITEEDFNIIFATFSRTGTGTGMSEVAFSMLDTTQSGSLVFRDFIKFMAVLVKGDTQAKLTLCFSLFDSDNSGELTGEELVKLISKLPIDRIARKGKLEDPDDVTAPVALSAIGEIDDQDEAVVKQLEAEKAEMIRNRTPSIDPLSNTVGGSSASLVDKTAGMVTLKRRKKAKPPSEDAVAKAIRIVTEAYEDIGKDPNDSLTLDDFMALCDVSGVADFFAPF